MVMPKKNAVALSAMLCALMGCTGKTFKQFDISGPDPKSLSVDATQRFLLVKQMPNGEILVCAEPSPDAAMAVAAEIATSGVLPSGLQAALSGSRSESLASLGLRTPAIQLVRDLWYRACEGLMNGVHGPEELNIMAGKVDRLIVALAAFDAIANAPAAPAVAIGQVGDASASTEGTLGADGGTTGKTTTSAGSKSSTFVFKDIAAGSDTPDSSQRIAEIFRLFLIADLDGDITSQDAAIRKELNVINAK